jgi:hypothetical protein
MTNPETESIISYEFEPGKRSIFAEIYFPKKIAYQGAIFKALRRGLNEKLVRGELVDFAQLLLETELSVYPHWFDPERYKTTELRTKRPTVEQAKERMAMYASPFYGWSMYEVDGVFLSTRKRRGNRQIDEERTQVVRLIFAFNHRVEKRATKAGHLDVYRAILYWVMSVYGHTEHDVFWGEGEMQRFLARRSDWSPEKRRYAKRLYKELAATITKWIDDCGLFIFGYLVRALWNQIVFLTQIGEEAKLEDEIWVSSIFHFNINVMKPRKESLRRAILVAEQAKEQK